MFEELGSPPEELWDGPSGVVAAIMQWLQLEKGANPRSVRQTLQRHVEGESLTAYKGRQQKLSLGEALVAADCLECGTGREQAAIIVSKWRKDKGMEKPKVSSKAVRTGFNNLGGEVSRRLTEGTGSRDPDSAWATSRLVEMEQLNAQFEAGDEAQRPAEAGASFKLQGYHRRVSTLAEDPLHLIGETVNVPWGWWGWTPAKRKSRCDIAGYVEAFKLTYKAEKVAVYVISWEGQHFAMEVPDLTKLLPKRLMQPVQSTVGGAIPLESVGWLDEKHKEMSLRSFASKYEYRTPQSPGGSFKPLEEGGQLPPRQRRLKAKYSGDGGRFCFGVMMKRGADGEMEGHKIDPFDYSLTWLVGVKAFRLREAAELRRVANFERDGWGKVGLGVDAATEALPGGRFQLRYPDTWQEELRKECAKAHDGLTANTCITDLMDHVVAELTRLFADTPYADNFVIFHDALTQWWEVEAQEYLRETHGIGSERQLCIQGSNNDAVAARYQNKLVGDTPELCPLDSNLFSDFEYAMAQNVAHTHWLPHDHEEKFLLGTPAQVQKTMLRTWEAAVTSERIVQDIYRVRAAIKDIIEAKGAKVPERDNRHGRRQTRPYAYPSCPAAEALRDAKFRRLDPTAGPS